MTIDEAIKLIQADIDDEDVEWEHRKSQRSPEIIPLKEAIRRLDSESFE